MTALRDGEGYFQGGCFAAFSMTEQKGGPMQGVIQFTPTAIQITVTNGSPKAKS
jgi:hypothetical protein